MGKRSNGKLEAMLRRSRKQLLQRQRPPLAKHANERWTTPGQTKEEQVGSFAPPCAVPASQGLWGEVVRAWSRSERVLVLAVGGGNDSVSSLLLAKTLADSGGMKPFDVACMLPDVLEYEGVLQSEWNRNLLEIGEQSERLACGKPIGKFVEGRLAGAKDKTGLPLEKIWGFKLTEGSKGVGAALAALALRRGYGLVLAVDVGGDFVAVEENREVLSPMMDGIMLAALRDLKGAGGLGAPVFALLMGLGTDGESSPAMLGLALERIGAQERTFDRAAVSEQIAFYREWVEPLRYSRTADFTVRQIEGAGHGNPALFRGRFRTPQPGAEAGDAEVFYGNFMRDFDQSRYGKFYVFGGVEAVANPFAADCSSTLEWFMKIQSEEEKVNCEMNGQTLPDLGPALGSGFSGARLYFATPSRLFGSAEQEQIALLCARALRAGASEWMLFWHGWWSALPSGEATGLVARRLGRGLVLAGAKERAGQIDELWALLCAMQG